MAITSKTSPERHKVFGISDSLLNAVRDLYKPKDEKEIEEDPKLSSNEDSKAEDAQVLVEAGKGRPDVAATARKVSRKSGALRSKDSVASKTTARFKQRHAGKTVPTRSGTEGQPRATGKGSASRGGSKRPLGGASTVHNDLASVPEDEFRRKYGKSKSAMRTSLRDHYETLSINLDKEQDYQYNRNSWLDALSKVGKDGLQEETISEMHVTVQATPGGTTYKILSVSKDVGNRIKVGEVISDTALDDLKDSDVSISYKDHDSYSERSKKAKEHDDPDSGTDKTEQVNGGQAPGRDPSGRRFNPAAARTRPKPSQPGRDPSGRRFNPAAARTRSTALTHPIPARKPKPSTSGTSKPKTTGGTQLENVEEALAHDCASHVKHEQWGEGQCISGQHTLVEKEKKECEKCGGDGEIDGEECEHCNGKGFHMEGFVTHYDVMFESGIQENVPVGDLEIIKERHHSHNSKKKAMKEDDDDNDDNGNGDNGDEDDNDKPKKKKKKKLDKVDKDELEGSHDERDDKDIDNDGDIDQSDKFLHKKRKAISKNIKEWINFAQKKPGDGNIKNAMEANHLAQHYLQMAQRDKIFGRESSENEKLAKQFYEQYKEMKESGDESDDDTFQNEKVIDALESIKEEPYDMARLERDALVRAGQRKQDRARKVAKTSLGTPHKIPPSYNTKTHKLVKKKGQEGLKTVPKDYKLSQGEYEAEEVQEPEDSTNLPEHAPEVVEYTSSQYAYNRSSWMDALQEVNRYKGRSGHRVTKPDKEGPEHIIMQLRKVETMGDKHGGVDFNDGTKVKVKPETAKKALEKYARMKPDEKEKWQKTAAHSHGGLSHATSDKKIDHTSPGQPKPRAARKEFDPLDYSRHPDDA